MPRRRIDAAVVVFALLVVATIAAFGYAQRLKRDPLVVDRVEFGLGKRHLFTPETSCGTTPLRIKFRTTTSNHATVEVIEPGGAVVATLAHGRFLKRYSYHVLHWNGVEGAGGPAPDGHYRLRLKLEGEGRTLVLPGTIRLHRTHAKHKLNCLGVSEPQ